MGIFNGFIVIPVLLQNLTLPLPGYGRAKVLFMLFRQQAFACVGCHICN